MDDPAPPLLGRAPLALMARGVPLTGAWRGRKRPAARPPAQGARRLGAWLGVALLCCSVSAPAEFVGRLFTTPAERVELDGLREGEDRSEQASEAQSHEAPAPAAPLRPIRMDGMVLRSAGPNAVWIDGQPVPRTGVSSQGMRVDLEGMGAEGVPIRVPGSHRSVLIKPGQRFEPAGHVVSDVLRQAPPPDYTPGPGTGQ